MTSLSSTVDEADLPMMTRRRDGVVGRKSSIPELLRQRQTFGSGGTIRRDATTLPPPPPPHHHHQQKQQRYQKERTALSLASKVAWNSTRMTNMILCVGPGTPASVLSSSTSTSYGAHHRSSDNDDDDEEEGSSTSDNDEEEDYDDEDEEDVDSPGTGTGQQEQIAEQSGNGDEAAEAVNSNYAQDIMEQEQEDHRTRSQRDRLISMELAERTLMEWMEHRDDDDDDDDDNDNDLEEDDEEDHDDIDDLSNVRRWRHRSSVNNHNPRRRESSSQPLSSQRPEKRIKTAPSIRHGGCINTACWLTCPWRLSSTNSNMVPTSLSSSSATTASVLSEEVPTQLMTSGDDRLVKFWDVRHAMGMTSPWEGGKSTFTPFSSDIPGSSVVTKWNDRHRKQQQQQGEESILPGMVIPLASISTRHQGNVFHVTPRMDAPGKVLTCAADGFLRQCDLEHGTSSIVVSPEYDFNNSDSGNSDDDDDDDERRRRALLSSLRPGMCFSHHLLDANTGVLCSEHGLRRFDLRLRPSEQPSRCLLADSMASVNSNNGNHIAPFTMAKACAVWSTDSMPESSYIFCGGNTPIVRLYDLRMMSDHNSSSRGGRRGQRSRVVQSYCPRAFQSTSGSARVAQQTVSVSGLDLSKDRKELLVSYENDQIYTFPVFPDAKYGMDHLHVDELEEYTNNYNLRGSSRNLQHCPDMASYGGHLNRFTFLKNARYAGLNDEYICTGSDSGHAWILERSTGSVAALLRADHSTCNGVVPHPSLPFFISYGIDSTAKVWRATTPVDPKVDDSPMGRLEYFHQSQSSTYRPSPVVANWKYVEDTIRRDSMDGTISADGGGSHSSGGDGSSGGSSIDTGGDVRIRISRRGRTNHRPHHHHLHEELFPDDIPRDREAFDRAMFGGLSQFFMMSNRDGTRDSVPPIGNDMKSLPEVLRKNLFACVQARQTGEEAPVKSPLIDLKRRVTFIRLYHQAKERGLTVTSHAEPWMFKSLIPSSEKEITSFAKLKSDDVDKENGKLKKQIDVDPADLIPENPSDWLPFDSDMVIAPLDAGLDVNLTHNQAYEDAALVRHGDVALDKLVAKSSQVERELIAFADEKSMEERACCQKVPSEMKDEDAQIIATATDSNIADRRVVEPVGEADFVHNQKGVNGASNRSDATKAANAIFLDTILLLKQSGNKAFKGGNVALAAHRYDTALKYCAAATMSYETAFLAFHTDNFPNQMQHPTWNPLLKLIIGIRLNLAMVLVKEPIEDSKAALDQARRAVLELAPFCLTPGTIQSPRKGSNIVYSENEPIATFQETKEMSAKALFRCASAHLTLGEYTEAIRYFEVSIKEAKVVVNEDGKTISMCTAKAADPAVLRGLAEAKRKKANKNKRQKKLRDAFSKRLGEEVDSNVTESVTSTTTQTRSSSEADGND